MKTKIYLASPYTHENKQIEQERFEAAAKAAGQLMLKGFLVFSPIAHSHPIAMQNDLPTDIDYWMEFDKSFLEWADELVILNIQGWSASIGVDMERKIAYKKRMPISIFTPINNIFINKYNYILDTWTNTNVSCTCK